MRATRSSTRSLTKEATTKAQESQENSSNRKAPKDAPKKPLKKAKAAPAAIQSAPNQTFSVPARAPDDADEAIVPAVLSFSFEDAKKHLIAADPRFKHMFEKVPCKPFEHLEQLLPFRTLTSSILGQQISWMAARSIQHKFIRLYDPSIPELHSDYHGDFFPTARQVANTNPATLRTAGFSQRKAEYVQDLASRFADGRLSTEKLLKATDEELAEMLIAVKGIGPWTVDMFAIFSLRRPNILPVGDLGVQRGVLRWFLSLHSPSYNIGVSPHKEPSEASKKKSKKAVKKNDDGSDTEDDEMPQVGGEKGAEVPPDASAVPPAPKQETKDREENLLPPKLKPSVNKILHPSASEKEFKPPALPDGLTVASMKSRMDGKNKIKGALLTPKEMEELTDPWKPYRSLGVYYMWALAEADA